MSVPQPAATADSAQRPLTLFEQLEKCYAACPSPMDRFFRVLNPQLADAFLVSAEIKKPQTEWRSSTLKGEMGMAVTYLAWRSCTAANVWPMFEKATAFWRTAAERRMIWQIIVAELRHPSYRSFFHGTMRQIAVLFALQKKLYHQHMRKGAANFEFLRSRDERLNGLKGIDRTFYVKKNNKKLVWMRKYIIRLPIFDKIKEYFCWPSTWTRINDSKDPWRAELLSVSGRLWPSLQFFRADLMSFPPRLYNWACQALAAYGLPMPYDRQTFNLLHPPFRSKEGCLLHILLSHQLVDRLVYSSDDYGVPTMPLDGLFGGDRGFRMILAPDVFYHPPLSEKDPGVKMFLYQERTPEEQRALDRFCKQIITDARREKEELEEIIRRALMNAYFQ